VNTVECGDRYRIKKRVSGFLVVTVHFDNVFHEVGQKVTGYSGTRILNFSLKLKIVNALKLDSTEKSASSIFLNQLLIT
jgi:hypothetical protein